MYDDYFKGDVIGVQRNADDIKEPNMASGIVTRVTDDIITVAFEEDFEISSSKETFKLIKLFNDITYKRLKRYKLIPSFSCCRTVPVDLLLICMMYQWPLRYLTPWYK